MAFRKFGHFHNINSANLWTLDVFLHLIVFSSLFNSVFCKCLLEVFHIFGKIYSYIFFFFLPWESYSKKNCFPDQTSKSQWSSEVPNPFRRWRSTLQLQWFEWEMSPLCSGIWAGGGVPSGGRCLGGILGGAALLEGRMSWELVTWPYIQFALSASCFGPCCLLLCFPARRDWAPLEWWAKTNSFCHNLVLIMVFYLSQQQKSNWYTNSNKKIVI